MILPFCLLFLSLPVFAASISSGIAGVELSRNDTDPHLVFLQDGTVGRLSVDEIGNLVSLSSGLKNGEKFKMEIDQNRYILKVQQLGKTSGKTEQQGMSEDLAPIQYEPTIVSNMPEATAIFNELNPNYRRRSECYNRAHVWSYEEYKRINLHSMKVFLFFTSKYIWDYNWDWWFHVSPYILVNENNEITERVIDYRFMAGPTKMKNWTNYFIIPQTECPTVAKYSDYENHQNESYCYLIKTSMYFWQPRDIDTLERTGKEKTSFLSDEVAHAYWQGF